MTGTSRDDRETVMIFVSSDSLRRSYFNLLRPLRVLIVDDQPDVVELLMLLVERFGHRCRMAFTGDEALLVAAEFDPEVVLLDLGLPDRSGYDVARELRERMGTTVFLAAITGWGKEADRMRAFAAGFDRHIQKPATESTIQDVLVSAAFRLRA